jgi:hypothetical protein
MVDFTFNGRYTLREINDVYYIYDREISSIIDCEPQRTFNKAKAQLIEFKKVNGDVI